MTIPLKIEVTEGMRDEVFRVFYDPSHQSFDDSVIAALTAAFQHPEFVAQLDRWLPIESAPTARREFFLASVDGVVVMAHHHEGQIWQEGEPDGDGFGAPIYPTHWQPLPEPPRASLGRLLGEEGK